MTVTGTWTDWPPTPCTCSTGWWGISPPPSCPSHSPVFVPVVAPFKFTPNPPLSDEDVDRIARRVAELLKEPRP